MVDFSDEMFNLSIHKNLDEEVEKLFQFYRQNGYPNYDKENYNITKEIQKLKDFNENSLLVNNHITQNMLGLGILWTYHPHWIEIKCGNSLSLKELWEDDDKLRELIRKTYVWKLKHNEPHWTNNRIRQNAKVFLSKQSVSNFRPTVAKYIYNTYGNNGTVLDMSAGFGGRLLGFLSSNCKKYIGFEPSTKTYNGLLDMVNDSHTNKEVEILKQGSEIYNNNLDNSIDLCFTSPPYFDTEKYSDEDTQSYMKYPTQEEWLNGFLNATISNCWRYCKDNAYMLINIANVKTCQNLESETIRFSIECGFNHIDTIYMEMSSISGKTRKIEPIFIFQK